MLTSTLLRLKPMLPINILLARACPLHVGKVLPLPETQDIWDSISDEDKAMILFNIKDTFMSSSSKPRGQRPARSTNVRDLFSVSVHDLNMDVMVLSQSHKRPDSISSDAPDTRAL
jgi:hypothetical protein